MVLRRSSKRPENGARTLFFATDLHASDVCFRKFVSAAAFYGADLLILGGDLTGKLVVPVVEQPDGRFRIELHGREELVEPEAVERLERHARDSGLYPARIREEEYEHLQTDPEQAEALFRRLMRERVLEWIRYAHGKLEGTDVRIVTAPGNDDPFEVDDIIREYGGNRVVLGEGEILDVAPGHELLSTGYSNPTPWRTHRELTESELRARIERMAERLEHRASAIFNLHAPPYDSGLDTAPSLDDDLAVKTSFGAQLSGPAGSTAVRDVLEEYGPLVSLHGHIHEAGGAARIGRTVAINAGSEYGEGILRGALVTVGGGKLHRYQTTAG